MSLAYVLGHHMITVMMLQTTNRLIIKSSHNAENQLVTLFLFWKLGNVRECDSCQQNVGQVSDKRSCHGNCLLST